MIKFVHDHVGGAGTKRKQGLKSCEICKKRHKRCRHGDAAPASPAALGDNRESLPLESRGDTQDGHLIRPPSPLQATAASTSPPQPRRGSEARPMPKDAYLRFVGDLSPEASFLSNQQRGPHDATQRPRHAEVGVWLGQRPEAHVEGGRGPEKDGASAQLAYNSTMRPSGLTALRALSSHLRQECISVLPPQYDLDIIMSLYYAKFDPIFPILRGEALDNHSLPESVALKQCICLVAALDPKLSRHLRLPHTEIILGATDFRGCLYDAVKQSLDMGFIHDKVVLLQVCALMAFTADETNCSEVSTFYVTQAVHHSQTLGLHLGWPDDGPGLEKPKRLFWCTWILDRLNASANGRPILMHQQDMDMRILETHSEQDPPFRLLIRISRLLDTVISRYRPHSVAEHPSVVDENLTFEHLVRDSGATDLNSPLCATLEMFYLAVLILRERPKETGEPGQPAPSSDLQLFASASIISIASEDFKSSITFWPAVSYAVSLAASVAYKSLRNSSLAYRRKRAYALFHASCDALDELGKAFSSARTVARLATHTLQEVERVASDRSKARQIGRADLACSRPSRKGLARDPNAFSTAQEQGYGEHLQTGQEAPTSGSVYQGPHDSTLLHLESPSVFDDWIGDAGIFNDFDPNFDLDRIDQVFSANLDPMQPPPPQDWMGYIQQD